jgi:hypothetical protein
MSVYYVQYELAFEWDSVKDGINGQKHGIAFRDASSAFADRRAVVLGDPDHSTREDRFLLLGRDCRGRVLVVSHCLRGEASDEVLRIISARQATPRERDVYESRMP